MKTREQQQAMVDKLKTTWTAFGGLSNDEQMFMRDNKNFVGWITASGAFCDAGGVLWCEGTCYRLSPYFKLPPEQPKERVPDNVEPCFVEYPVTINRNMTMGYRCKIDHINNSVVPIHKLPSIVGFAGIKYRKADGKETNFLDRCVYTQGSNSPATPIAARFEIKGETK